MFWSMRDIPELKHLPQAQATELQERAWRLAQRSRGTWGWLGLAAVVTAVPVFMLAWPWFSAVEAISAGLVAYVPTITCVVLILRPNLLYPYILRCVAMRCRQCGYSLIGNESEVCPECGRPVTAGIRAARRLPRPKLGKRKRAAIPFTSSQSHRSHE